MPDNVIGWKQFISTNNWRSREGTHEDNRPGPEFSLDISTISKFGRDGTREVSDSDGGVGEGGVYRVAALHRNSLRKEKNKEKKDEEETMACVWRHTARMVSLVELSAEKELPVTI